MSVIDQLRRDLDSGSGVGRLYRAVDIPHVLVAPIVAVLLFMFVGPMAILVLFSVQSGNEIALNPATWTLASYVEFVTGMVTGSGVYGQVLTTTTLISVSTVVLTLVFSFPAAYALARKIHRFKTALLVALILPLLNQQ